ncbi:MAG: hypothetical protein OXU70_12415 [Gammaproteobacteria bacterium]|nr:hypothetical protein [Gammaproteobacteria bacterium]
MQPKPRRVIEANDSAAVDGLAIAASRMTAARSAESSPHPTVGLRQQHRAAVAGDLRACELGLDVAPFRA